MRSQDQDINIYELDDKASDDRSISDEGSIEFENVKTSDLGDIDRQMGHVDIADDHVATADTASLPDGVKAGPIFGIVALVLGSVSVLTSFLYFIGIPLGVAAIVLGWFSISRRKGCDSGLAGMIAGVIGIVFALLILSIDIFGS